MSIGANEPDKTNSMPRLVSLTRTSALAR